MNRFFLALVFFGIVTAAYAQPGNQDTPEKALTGVDAKTTLHILDHYSSSGHSIVAKGSFGLNSNALTNSFYSPFLVGGKITEDLKSDVNARMGGNNTAGFDFDYGIYYKQRIDSLFGNSQCFWTYNNVFAVAEAAGGEFLSSSPSGSAVDSFTWHKNTPEVGEHHRRVLEGWGSKR